MHAHYIECNVTVLQMKRSAFYWRHRTAAFRFFWDQNQNYTLCSEHGEWMWNLFWLWRRRWISAAWKRVKFKQSDCGENTKKPKNIMRRVLRRGNTSPAHTSLFDSPAKKKGDQIQRRYLMKSERYCGFVQTTLWRSLERRTTLPFCISTHFPPLFFCECMNYWHVFSIISLVAFFNSN